MQGTADRNAVAVDRAVQRAFRDWLDRLQTEPMTVSQLCSFWGEVSCIIMRRILEQMEGAEQFPTARGGNGMLWRVPASKMPLSYLTRIGLLQPREIPAGHK